MRIPVTVLLGLVSGFPAGGTDLFYGDEKAASRDGRYVLEAKSPENAPGVQRRAFQSRFVYTLRDTQTKKELWRRAQPMTIPKKPGDEPFPAEGSPVALFVSNSARSVIWTGWSELIVLDSTGTKIGEIGLLKDFITKAERRNYVHETTAGPLWTGCLMTYFMNLEDEYLVVRPWWGRRGYLKLKTGKLATETKRLKLAAEASEGRQVLAALQAGAAGDGEAEVGHPQVRAAFLAGKLGLREAVPFLRMLEASDYSCSSTMGGLGISEKFEGEVNPHDYSDLTLRQAVQLSLRRLGEVPKESGSTLLKVDFEDFDRRYVYEAAARDVPRHENAAKVEVGMSAEEVLDLLGHPDFITHSHWEYDMDVAKPFTFLVTFGPRKVKAVKRDKAAWKDGFRRDELIVY